MISIGIAAAPRLASPPVIRFVDWDRRLRAWIDGAQSRRFIWGEWDCCLAMADAVRTMTGVDVADRVRGKYGGKMAPSENALDVAKLIMRLTGVATFEGAVAAEITLHGLPEIRPQFAQRGDVAMGDGPDGPTWGIVDLTGARALFALAPRGLQWIALAKCRRAWKVG